MSHYVIHHRITLFPETTHEEPDRMAKKIKKEKKAKKAKKVKKASSSRRRVTGGALDVFTALAAVGTIALLAAFVILWMAGTDSASQPSGQNEMPWTIMSSGR